MIKTMIAMFSPIERKYILIDYTIKKVISKMIFCINLINMFYSLIYIFNEVYHDIMIYFIENLICHFIICHHSYVIMKYMALKLL